MSIQQGPVPTLPQPPLGLRMTPGEIALMQEQQRFDQLVALASLPPEIRALEVARLKAIGVRERAALDLAEAELLADSPMLHPSIVGRPARVAAAYQLKKLADRVGLDASFLAPEAYVLESGSLSLGADTVVALVTHALGDRLVAGFRVEASQETTSILIDLADPAGPAVAVPSWVRATCQLAGEEPAVYTFTAFELAQAPWARDAAGMLKAQYRSSAAMQMGRRAKVRLIRSVPALHMASQGLGVEDDAIGNAAAPTGSVAQANVAKPSALDRVAARAEAKAAVVTVIPPTLSETSGDAPAATPTGSRAAVVTVIPPTVGTDGGPAMPEGEQPTVLAVESLQRGVRAKAREAARFAAEIPASVPVAAMTPEQRWRYSVELTRQQTTEQTP